MRTFMAGLALVSLTPLALADVIVVPSSRDNTLYESATGAVSNGAGENVFAGLTTQGIRRGLMHFQVDSMIPAGSTVTAVQLVLNVTNANNVPTDYTLQRVLSNWGEGTSDAGLPGGQGTPSSTGDATWIHTFFNTAFWTTVGGDFSSTVSATANLTATAGPLSWTSAQMVADVQAWVNSPGANFGWVIRNDEATLMDSARFASRENTSPALRPALSITFTPIPEPATLLLTGVGLAGGWTIRRLRRQCS